MKERPILFSGPMVRALLAGTKTQTRRVVKPQPSSELLADYAEIRALRGSYRTDAQMLSDCVPCPYGVPGDLLWVRETFYHEPAEYRWEASLSTPGCPEITVYRADGGFDGNAQDAGCKWQPSIHMPRKLSRITLRITDVRVERLQDISEADARAEGIVECPIPADDEGPRRIGYMVGPDDGESGLSVTPIEPYRSLWESINGPGSWEANPWVWVVSFERVTP